MKDIPFDLCHGRLNVTLQLVSALGQLGSLRIEILIESLLKEPYIPSQAQKLLVEINEYADGVRFLQYNAMRY